MDLKAFAAGEMAAVPGRGIGFTERPSRKPLIAAVEGYALAGGTEAVAANDSGEGAVAFAEKRAPNWTGT